MTITARSVTPFFAFLLAGCSADKPTAPLATSDGESVALRSDDRGGIEAAGAGTIDLSAAGATPASFFFVATKNANGKVFGFFWQSRKRGDLLVEFAGRVTCLTTDPAFPGRARIGGVVTMNNSTDPAFLTENHQVGDDVWFRVTDSRGGTDGADASTTYGFKPTLVNTSDEYCALPFTGAREWNPASIFPLERGAIHVKD
jgi:hypothetical protein